MATKKIYLGIDPGRSKTGLALVDEQGHILKLHIAATAEMGAELKAFLDGQFIEGIVMGDGTNSTKIGAIAREICPEVALHLVGEAHSTEEARQLYWRENPPQGWRKLVPLGLQVPPIPLDAYAAVVQVRRYLSK